MRFELTHSHSLPHVLISWATSSELFPPVRVYLMATIRIALKLLLYNFHLLHTYRSPLKGLPFKHPSLGWGPIWVQAFQLGIKSNRKSLTHLKASWIRLGTSCFWAVANPIKFVAVSVGRLCWKSRSIRAVLINVKLNLVHYMYITGSTPKKNKKKKRNNSTF